ncbi:MAG: VIT1/CCC1 transporter family protein [Bacillota bacterium]
MLTRNLDKARQAYKDKNVEASRKAHEQKSTLHAREAHNQEHGQYIKSLIYGGLDGIITTFAVVAGVAGASLSAGIVLILGFANLIADGLSMAIGDYLSTKAEQEYKKTERERETWEVENYPDGEKQELVELYMNKGMPEEDARTVTEIFSRNKKAWVNIMMVEELGIIEENESPIKNALVTFFSFAIFGFVPLVAYVISKAIPGFGFPTFILASVLTGVTLYTLGAVKGRITGNNWIKSGFEMLIVGGVAAAAAYGVGLLLAGLE